MSLSVWLQGFRNSIAQKQTIKSGGASAVIVAQVKNGARVSTTTLSDAGAFPRHHASAIAVLDPDGEETDDDFGVNGFDEDHEVLKYEYQSNRHIQYLADVPSEFRERLQDEAVMRLIRRLETPLRGLYVATSRKGLSCPPDELRGFLLMWRRALGENLCLTPDERQSFDFDIHTDEAYFVRGRARPGTRLAVIEPAWTMNGAVAIRGEAQVMEESGELASEDAGA